MLHIGVSFVKSDLEMFKTTAKVYSISWDLQEKNHGVYEGKIKYSNTPQLCAFCQSLGRIDVRVIFNTII